MLTLSINCCLAKHVSLFPSLTIDCMRKNRDERDMLQMLLPCFSSSKPDPHEGLIRQLA